MMSFDLSYLQLKTTNDSRVAEEVQSEKRLKSLLVLMSNFLEEQGYLDTLQALKKEAGVVISKYEVCDNIDLLTILQEYEAYYFVKFKKQPKIMKKIMKKASGSAEPMATTPSKGRKVSSASKLYHLPPILGGSHESDNGGSCFIDEGKHNPITKGGARQKKNTKIIHREELEKEASNKQVQGQKLEVEGTVCSMSSTQDKLPKEKNESKEECDNPQEKLLKPLAGFTGYNSEMRELAAIISKDIYLENPAVSWSDIIGLDSAKRLIKEAVVYPIKDDIGISGHVVFFIHKPADGLLPAINGQTESISYTLVNEMYPQLFKGILSPWKGLLLYGPPGTGKTLLAKAVATECKTTFFNISASTIVSKWRGDSEKLVRVLFELARFHAPSTIFIDELESIMGQRSGFSGGGEHEGSRRMKTELLVQMDGLSRSNDLVFLLAASNLPWDLDHAMLRRLEKRILVDLPIQSARKAMFLHHLPPIISSKPLKITSSIDYDTIAKKTEGYSGSDIFLVCKEAAMIPLRKVFDRLEAIDDIDGSSDIEGLSIDPISTLDVELAIRHTKPSAKNIAGQYEKWQLKYESS